MKKIIITTVLLIQIFNVFSQKTILNQDSVISISLRNYPAIKASDLEIEKQKTLKISAYDFGTTSIYTGKEEVGQNAQAGIFNKIAIEQNDINIFGIIAKTNTLKVLQEQATIKQNITEKMLIRDVKKAYYTAVAYRKKMFLLKHLDSLFAGFEKASKLKYETNESSKIEYLTASAKYKQLKIAVKTVQNNYLSALQILNKYLSVNFIFDVDTTFPLVSNENFSDSNLQNSKLKNYYETEVLLAEKKWKQEKSTLLPKLNASYKVQSIDNKSGFYAWQIGVSAPLLFFSQSGKNKSARLDYEISKLNYQTKMINMKTEVNNLQQKLDILKQILDYYKTEALPLADEQIKANYLAYKLGNVDYIEFTENVESAIKTKSDFIDKQLEFFINASELEFYN